MQSLLPPLCPSLEGWGPLSPIRPVDFTTCFQHGALVAGLNLAFVVGAAVRLSDLRSAPLLPRAIVVSGTLWAKLFASALALAASTAELVLLADQQLVFSVFGISLALQTVAAAVALRLHYREQLASRVASTPLLLFWLATVLLALMRLRTAVTMGLWISNVPVVAANAGFMLAALAALVLESQPKPHLLYELPD
ncbi:hypothetical protein GGF37_006507, partial [Kickxella alabastrina]